MVRTCEHLARLDEWLAAVAVEARRRSQVAARLERYSRGWAVYYGSFTQEFHAIPAWRGAPKALRLSFPDVRELRVAIEQADVAFGRRTSPVFREGAVPPPHSLPRGTSSPHSGRGCAGQFVARPGRPS
jgi:hypothetical protein